MHVIRVRYGSDTPRRVADTVRYISHREEGLQGGHTRPLYGIGERFRELRGDERAIIDRLVRDADGLKQPVYYRLRLTLNDQMAGRLADLAQVDIRARERVLRDAVEKALRGVARSMQGVFVVHEHGGQGRPSGHPHVHVYLSPLQTTGEPVRRKGPRWITDLRARWTLELDRAATRYEQRIQQLARGRTFQSPSRSPMRGRSHAVAMTSRGLGTARSLLPWAATGLSIARSGDNGERTARRVAWRVASMAMPAPFRRVAHVIARLLPRER